MRIFDIHKTFTAFLLALVLCSCVKLEEDLQSGVGYLEFPTLNVDTDVENIAGTKMTPDGFVFEAPELSDVFIMIMKEGETEIFKTINAMSLLTTLPVGNYILQAVYSTNSFGTPYLVGQTTIAISRDELTQASLSLALANSIVRVKVDESLQNDFKGETVFFSATVDGNVLNFEAACNQWVYVPSGADISVSLSGTNSVGNTATFTHKLTAPAAKTAYEVICRKDATDWPTITIPPQQDGAWANRLYITPGASSNNAGIPLENIQYQVSASESDWSSAKTSEVIDGYHVVDGLVSGATYYVRGYVGNIYSDPHVVTVRNDNPLTIAHRSSNNELSGTDVSLDFGFTGILKTLYDEGKLAVNTVLSNTSVASVNLRSASSDATAMDEAEGWPYLPEADSYVLTCSHKLTSEASYISSSISGISVPSPSFTVSLGKSYSSYDYGTETGAQEKGFNKNIAKANGLNAETIYDVSASYSGISAELLNNDNYKKEFIISLDGTAKASSSTVTSLNVGAISGLSTWKAYTLKASVTFAGTKIEASRTHHITGLPYSVAPPKTSGTHAWSGTATNNSDNMQIYGWKDLTSPTFYIPGNIEVKVTSSLILKANSWMGQQVACYFNIGDQVDKTGPCSSTSEKSYSISGTGTFTSSDDNLVISSQSASGKSYTKVLNVKIVYQ